ncbi:MAG: MBOAT family protein [Proteobacteria bacterium]|nr:MBOAT family protein [Pseudomonadota bacterium]
MLLICLTTIVNYFLGNQIGRAYSDGARKKILLTSVVFNLGVLGFFKYYNFFTDVLADILLGLGWGDHSFSLQIILPIGISFYTFQILSYTIDIYRKQISPTDSFLDFALFVAFFPQLCAGPIMRATNLMPQITSHRTFSPVLLKTSCFLFLFGLFEKTVVADNLSVLVDSIYNSGAPDGFSVLLATYAFAIQIFADFDGYSNMAKGLAGVMGFTLVTNFDAPYFSENPSQFWNRWHISLSSWLRDYLYIPLGGNRGGMLKTARNLFTTMILGGLWHGASWMFIYWGAFHGILLAVYLPLNKKLACFPPWLRKLMFFHLICFGWMLFKAHNPVQFNGLLHSIFFNFQFPFQPQHLILLKQVLFYSAVPVLYQYLQYRKSAETPIAEWPLMSRSAVYVFLFYMIVIFGFSEAQSFIYFKF